MSERQDPFEMEGRRVLVTGASSGLGRHFCELLARRGARVIAAARRLERLEALAEAVGSQGGELSPVALDVCDPASVEAAFARIAGELGGVDVLVNNAGVAVSKPALDQDEEDFDRVIGTNLRGCWRVAKAFAAHRIAAGEGPRPGGVIVNIASIAALRPAGALSLYAASKAGLAHLTRNLALEWARYGIRVNALAPGYVRTEMNSAFFDSPPGQAMIKTIPQRRIGDPKDLDGPLLLLCSEASAFMTGSILAADGGHQLTGVG